MPTGYTAAVLDGDVWKVKDYLRTCARAFGAFASQRDESLASPPRVPEVDVSYEAKSLVEAKGELDSLLGWSPERITREHEAYIDRTERENARTKRRWQEKKTRLEKMLKKVQAWTPNDQAQPVKDFAISQLEETIRFDVGNGPWLSEIELDEDAWFTAKVEHVKSNIEYYEEQLAERLKRQVDNAAYAKAVLDSIEGITE